MAEVRVRCAGTPIETHAREAPTEYDLIQPCGWEGTAELADWCICGDSVRLTNAMPDGCPTCHGVVEIVQGGDATAEPDGTPAGAEVEAHAEPAGPPDQGGDAHDSRATPDTRHLSAHVTGPAVATNPTDPTAGPSDLDQAIQEATRKLRDEWDWDGYEVDEIAHDAVEAAAPVLLQATQDYTSPPDAWGHEAAAELDRLATFERRIRPGEFAPKRLCTCHGCIRVRDAIAALDRARERTDG